MNSRLLFLTMCIPLRVIFALLPNYNLIKKIGIKFNPKIFYTLYALILLVISFGFLYLYFTNSRLNAPEAGGKTWWYNLRLLHGMLYLCATIYILWNINNLEMIKYASLPLILDVIVGLCSFINHRYLKK